MYIDFHSHVLPEMDDGADSVKESIALLQKEKEDGVETVVATPHFYMEFEEIDCFLERRSVAYSKLMEATQGLSLPRIVLGAEVYFTPSIVQLTELERLCVDSTRYLMIELPHVSYGLYNNIAELIMTHNVTPILAHVERYLDFMKMGALCELFTLDILGQLNCSSLFDDRKKAAFKCIKSGLIDLLGTDCHNMTDRKPLFTEACHLIEKKCSSKVLAGMLEKGEGVFIG